MKVKTECAECLIKRAVKEIDLATSDEKTKIKAIKEIFKMACNGFNKEAVPADLGTRRYRLIKKVTGAGDYYRGLKQRANKYAMKIVDKLRLQIEASQDMYQRFRLAALAAIAGNSMEFFVLGNDFQIQEIDRILDNSEAELAVDEISEIYQLAKSGANILYLTDNAGEIAFDTLLVEQLKLLGVDVTVAVKKSPIMNDAILEDAEMVKMPSYATRVITTGSSSVGLAPSECSPILMQLLESSDLIVAKGMGYYETLGEIKLNRPVAILLRTKCKPVAENIGVPQNKNVAKIIRPE